METFNKNDLKMVGYNSGFFKIYRMDCFPLFSAYEIHPFLIKGLEDSHYYRSTSIQDSLIKNLGKDKQLLLNAESGSGKTCAFCIAIIEIIARRYFISNDPFLTFKGSPLAFVLVPTPELSEQIRYEFDRIARYFPFIINSVSRSIDMQTEWSEVLFSTIVIGTPGTILKLIKKRKFKLNKLLCLVFDEWDKMFIDKYLLQDIQDIYKYHKPELSSIIASSATTSHEAYNNLHSMIGEEWKTLKSLTPPIQRTIKHYLCRTGSFEKRIITCIDLFRTIDFHQAIIFCNLHGFAEETVRVLNCCGFPCVFLSNKTDVKERQDIVSEFRDLQLRCVVTTDLVARGIDISSVNIVISLDFPHDPETFLHRIGRTGRFGSDGISLTFYSRRESSKIPLFKQAINVEFEPYDINEIPHIHLLPLRNEDQLGNLKILHQKENESSHIVYDYCGVDEEEEEGPKEKEVEQKPPDRVEINTFCGMSNDYWDIYKRQCEQHYPMYKYL